MPAPLKRSSESLRAELRLTTDVGLPRQPLSDAAYLRALGRRVREAREQRGMARKVLAEVSGVSERYLAQLESGSGNASVTLLRRVAAALNVRITHLLGCDTSAQRTLVSSFVDSIPERRLDEVLRRLVGEFGTDESVRRKRIALIGLRGGGKSTLGSALARVIRRPFIELDRHIEREAGMALSEIFLLYGQSGYRDLERRCLDRIITGQSEVVISVGGGVVSEPESYQLLLTNCFTVWIKASPAEHMSRVIAQGDLRPMQGHAQAMEDLKTILIAREPLYARADAAVDTSGVSVTKSLAALRLIIGAASK
jgi:XRE family aerobic/anaerobic benzoate catabolism transcriptional regulator